MKRCVALCMIVSAILLAGFAAIKSEARVMSSTQFYGKAFHQNGDPAPQGTMVKALLGGVQQGSDGEVWDTRGNFIIQGVDSNFPTGTYSVVADDGDFIGSVTASHTQGTATLTSDITMYAY